MKKLLLLIPLLALAFFAGAQNRAVFNQYHLSPILINPAAAGFYEQHQVQFHARAQWTGFPDAPKTVGALYNGPIGNTFGVGVGIFTEQAAQLTEIRAALNYAFRFNITENIKFSAGFSTEFYQQTLAADVRNNDFYERDDVVEDAVNGRKTIDAAVGLFGTIYQNTYAGIALTNLVGERLDNISTGTTTDAGSLFSYYTFLVGHRFDLANNNFTLEPSMMVRQVKDAPLMADFNVKAGFLDEQLIAGLSYRTLGSLGVLLGTRLSSFQLFYTYDASLQQFQRYNSGTHEVTIALHFDRGNGNNPRRKRNPYAK